MLLHCLLCCLLYSLFQWPIIFLNKNTHLSLHTPALQKAYWRNDEIPCIKWNIWCLKHEPDGFRLLDGASWQVWSGPILFYNCHSPQKVCQGTSPLPVACLSHALGLLKGRAHYGVIEGKILAETVKGQPFILDFKYHIYSILFKVVSQFKMFLMDYWT